MTRKNVCLALLVVASLCGAGLLMNPFSGGAADVATKAEWADEADYGEAGILSVDSKIEPQLARTEVAAGAAAESGDEEDDSPRPALTVSGRVVSDGGTPVAGARVTVTYRLSFDAMRARDFGGGNRGRAFRQRPIAQAVTSDQEGRFTLEGRAFATSTLDVFVAHKDFSPATLQRDWSKRDGILQLGDILIAPGSLVTGFVVDADGKGIPGAEVRFQPSGQNGPGGGPGQNGPGPFGGRGRGGRGGNTEDEASLDSLIAAAKADATGFFRIEHVPDGRFRLQARASRYLPAVSDALQAKSGTAVDAGRLELILGVQLRGLVVDATGAPIADARVDAGPAQGQGPRGGRGGNGPNVGPNGSGDAAPGAQASNQAPDWQALAATWRAGGNDRRTRTDKHGEFVLDSLPPTPLRLRVEHPGFITEERQPIDAQKEPRVTVRLEPAMALSGRVVDANTGEPVTVFAIAAREDDTGFNNGFFGGLNRNAGNRGGDQGGRGRRGGGDNTQGGGRGGNQGGGADANADANGNDEFAAMRAAEEARRAQRTAFLQDRLGPSGQVPRNPGRMAKHADGRFTLPGLQPGRYLVDVMADEYVGVASGPIELVKGQAPGELTISIRHGSKITGLVEDKITHAPLAGVQVELQLPDIEAATQSNAAEAPWAMFRRDAGQVRVTRARTDENGRFVLRPQRSGDYWLSIEHDGYNTLVDRAVFVPDGRTLETPPYALVPGSELSGRILNPQEGKQYSLTFWSTTGQRMTARVGKDMRYRVESIEAGSYFALLSDGSGGDNGNQGGRGGRGGRGGMGGPGGMGTRLLEFARGNNRPDVVISEGAKVQFDIDARAQAPATVKGKVLLNGLAAPGYDVALSARDDNASASNGANPAALLGRMMGRLLSGRTNEHGEFSITNVPSGNYTLEVRRGGGGPGGGPGGGRGRGGGGGGGATVHREPIFVAQGATIERTLAFAIGSLAFEVSQETDGKPLDRANMSLALRSEAAGLTADRWRALPSFVNAQVRAGSASVRELKLGEWVYHLQAQGQAAVEGTVFVDASATPAPVKVKVKSVAPPVNAAGNKTPPPTNK